MQDLTTTLLELPLYFTTESGKRFALYRPTLGVMLLGAELLRQLNKDDEGQGGRLPTGELELLRLALDHRAESLRLVALHSIAKPQSLKDPKRLDEATERLDKELNTQDLASLLAVVLSLDDISQLYTSLGFDKLHEQRRAVEQAKDNTDSGGGGIHLGGLSLYGSTIDALASRYGWTLDYILWGLSYANIRLLLSDIPSYVYLSDEEWKRLPPQHNPRAVFLDENTDEAQTLLERLASESGSD